MGIAKLDKLMMSLIDIEQNRPQYQTLRDTYT